MISIREAVNRFLEALPAQGVTPCTVRGYSTDMRVFTRGLNGELLSELTPERIELFLARRVREEIAPRTLSRNFSALRALCTYLVTHHYIDRNPMESLKPPRKRETQPEFLTQEEVTRLLNSAKTYGGHRGKMRLALFEMLYSGGMRVSELCALDMHDIDLDTGKVKLHGKGGKSRTVMLGAPAREALRSYIKIRRLPCAGEEDALFVNLLGKRITQNSVRRPLKLYATRCGINKNVTPHVLRHSFATHLIENGSDLITVKEYLGHSSLSTTQIYLHLSGEHMRKIFKKCHPRAD